MPQKNENRHKIEEHCLVSGKYTPDAYEFITASVISQVRQLTEHRHLSAAEVLSGINRKLNEDFGFLAPEILKEWRIRSASDIGEIIFDLIELGILAASEDDKRSDFDIDFSLLPPMIKRTAARMEAPQID